MQVHRPSFAIRHTDAVSQLLSHTHSLWPPAVHGDVPGLRGSLQPPYFIAACAHKQMLAHNIIGTWSVLDDSSLLQVAFDAPSLCRTCALGAEASRGVVSANPHSKLAGCASKIHIVDVYSQ